MDSQQVSDPGRTPSAVDPDCDDPEFPARARAPLGAAGTAGKVLHPVFTLLTVAVCPARRGRDGHLETLGGPAQRPPDIDNAPGQPEPAPGVRIA
jgi:hypothetical protein